MIEPMALPAAGVSHLLIVREPAAFASAHASGAIRVPIEAREAEIRVHRDGYASLSRREREVMALVVSGLMNKQVGFELGISEITVKAHRGKVMRKMKENARLRLAPAPKG